MTNELVDFTLVSVALLAIGIYGLAVKRNFIRMLFAVEIIINAANLNLVAFGRFLPHSWWSNFGIILNCNCSSRSSCWIILNHCSIPYVSKCRYCRLQELERIMEYALLQAVFLPLLLSPVAYILGKK